MATVQDAVYQGTSSGTLVINPVSALITLGKLYQTFDGTPKPVSVSVTPAGTAVTVTYNGSTMPPTDVGQYSVVATINDPNFQGGTSATLTIYAPGRPRFRPSPELRVAGPLSGRTGRRRISRHQSKVTPGQAACAKVFRLPWDRARLFSICLAQFSCNHG